MDASGDTEVLVCFAMNGEAAPLRRALGGRAGLHIEVVGMGPKNAETGIVRLLERATPRLVLTCGLAGGLRPDLKLGDVVFATSDAELARRLDALGAQPAKFHCSERVAVSAEEKRTLRRETGADAVEMESAPIHAICRTKGIPCTTVRVISDTSDQDLPLDFNRLTKRDMSLGFFKLVWAIMCAPQAVPPLLRFQRDSVRAAERLSAVLAALLNG
jgi:adenosylhomocysteine nucleosidase